VDDQHADIATDNVSDPIAPTPGRRGRVVRVAGLYAPTGGGTVAPVVIAQPPIAGGGVVTAIPDNVAAVVLFTTDPTRLGWTVFNLSTANLFFGYGPAAIVYLTTTFFSVKIPPGGYYEPPAGLNFRAECSGIWDAAPGGNALITEMF